MIVHAADPVLRGGEAHPKAVKVLITGKLHQIALDLFQTPPKELSLKIPLEIVYHPDCSRELLLKEVSDAHVLVTRSETDVDEEVLIRGKHLSVIARAAVGYSNIDVERATELGILVLNTPGKNTNSAAELAFGLLLAVARKIPGAHATTSQGGWNRHHYSGFELTGKTIGIVGLGNVGHRMAKFARGFDMKVIAYDPYISEDVFRQHSAERKTTLQDLLRECDVLSVHVPLNKETRGMIREDELRLLRKNAVVVNAARGGVICEKALINVLNDGHLYGAGIDTWDNEPKPMQELVSHPRVVATPHIGASTTEAQFRIGETIAIQSLKALRGEICDYPVNLPHVSVIGTGNLRHFAVLAEKTASVARQILPYQPKELRLLVHDSLKNEDLQLIRLSALKGFLSDSSDEFVSYVNAERLLEKRGLSMHVSFTSEGVRANGMVLEVYGALPENKTRVGALLYDHQFERLYMIDDFMFEIEPRGEMFVLRNHDRPGVIGAVGTFLAKSGINIAQFELSRNRLGGVALSLIRVDGSISPEQVKQLSALENIISVRHVVGL